MALEFFPFSGYVCVCVCVQVCYNYIMLLYTHFRVWDVLI